LEIKSRTASIIIGAVRLIIAAYLLRHYLFMPADIIGGENSLFGSG
jgi:hypothetical protein